MSNDDVLAAQIKSSIITKIKTQEYLPGELLPSERDFATMYSVSQYLIHDIFDELISQHYLIRVQGKGTFVRKPEQNRVALGVLNESKNASFTSLVRNFGIEISNKCLGTGIIKNRKYFADKLGLSEEEIAARKAVFVQPDYKVKFGVLYKYAKSVADASEGCVTDL